MNLHYSFLLSLLSATMLLVSFSCARDTDDFSEPENTEIPDNFDETEWDWDWDIKYDRFTYFSPIIWDIKPKHFVWHDKLIPLDEEMLAFLRAEANKESTRPATIQTSDTGQVKRLLGIQALDIDKLTVVGPINKNDFLYIKRCIEVGNLRSLDFSNTILPDNQIPYRAFHAYEYPAPAIHYSDFELVPNHLPLFHISLPQGVTIKQCGLSGTLITEIDLSPVKSIEPNSFRWTIFLGGILDIPSTLESLSGSAFKDAGDGALVVNFHYNEVPGNIFYNANIKEINICDGVETLNSYALYKVLGLEKITLPATLKRMGNYSLGYNRSLKSIRVLFSDPDIALCDPTNPYKIFQVGSLSDGDNHTTHNAQLFVPADAYDAFSKSEIWNWFSEIIPE